MSSKCSSASALTRGDALTRPAALDQLGRAVGKQFESDRAAKLAGAISGTGALGFDEAAAILVEH